MSLTIREARWKLGDPVAEEALTAVMEGIDIPPVVGRLLVRRGITTPQEAKNFFNCNIKNLHNPFLMKDMDRAVARLQDALRAHETIAIYGDYDVDGISSVSLLVTVLKKHFNAPVIYHVPNRLKDGYGMSTGGLDLLQQRGATLVITVDCGITALQEAEHAQHIGLDLIITDHHEPTDSIPDVVAVLDPKRHDATYPVNTLAGVGVAFKLMQGLFKAEEKSLDALYAHLDLVALGTVADIVPLTNENRIMVRYGIERMEKTSKVGLRELLKLLGLKGGRLNAGRIVFGMAPRLNAAGRLGDAERGIRLLTTDNQEEAEQLVTELETENLKRREIDRETLEDADAMLDHIPHAASARSIVLASDTWHSGVIGIVASRLVEKYNVPTVLITFAADGMGRGSARSISSFNVYDAFKACSQHLEGFGGHMFAAGLSIRKENFEAFATVFSEYATNHLTEEDLYPRIHIEEELEFTSLNPRFMKIMHYFGPFGPKNMRPVFYTKGIRAASTPRIVGQNHLKLRALKGNKSIDTIGFGLGEHLTGFAGGVTIADIVYTPEENVWQGCVSIQLRLKDIRFQV